MVLIKSFIPTRLFSIAVNNDRIRKPNLDELRSMFHSLKRKYWEVEFPATPVKVAEETLDDRVRMLSSFYSFKVVFQVLDSL